MALFDVSKYQLPDPTEVDMKTTRQVFELFMSAYGAAREKVGKNRMPKMTQSFNPIPSTPHREYDGDAERFVIEREEFMPEYMELHKIFTIGYLAISNPLRDGGTERRRQIFLLRYIYGISIQNIADRTFLGTTSIVTESQQGFIQFCKATEMLIYKEETEPLIETK